jgi:hypothetical protein
MRAGLFALAAVCSLTLSSCNIFEGYYYPMRHYRFGFGAAAEQQYSTSLERTKANLKFVLQQHQISIEDVKESSEAVQIWASSNNNSYVFELKKAGESGCTVHAEINQAGADGYLWKILKDLQLLP